MASLISIESNPVFRQILLDFQINTVSVFRKEVQRADLNLTGEMLNSIRVGAIEEGAGFISAHIYFDQLMRIKDMKELRYKTVPPLSAMIEYVEKVGIDQFAYVPGYTATKRSAKKPRKEISFESKVKRVAGGLQFAFKRMPNVRRGYRGIYNDPLIKEILPQFYSDLFQASGRYALVKFREMF